MRMLDGNSKVKVSSVRMPPQPLSPAGVSSSPRLRATVPDTGAKLTNHGCTGKPPDSGNARSMSKSASIQNFSSIGFGSSKRSLPLAL